MLKLISYVCAPMNNKLMLCRRVGRFPHKVLFSFSIYCRILSICPPILAFTQKSNRAEWGSGYRFRVEVPKELISASETLILCCCCRHCCRCRRWSYRRHRCWRVLCTIIAFKINPLARPFDIDSNWHVWRRNERNAKIAFNSLKYERLCCRNGLTTISNCH